MKFRVDRLLRITGASPETTLYDTEAEYGMTRQPLMYVLTTTLPVRSKLLGQHYATPEDAQAAAERLLSAFITKIADVADPTTRPDATWGNK